MPVVSRASRPPGFDMTYRPREAVYTVPWLERLPSLVYLAAALVAVVLVLVGEHSDPRSWLFHYVVVQDHGRMISSRTFAVVLSLGAIASVLRGNMRGESGLAYAGRSVDDDQSRAHGETRARRV